jgi:hypothetical protein
VAALVGAVVVAAAKDAHDSAWPRGNEQVGERRQVVFDAGTLVAHKLTSTNSNAGSGNPRRSTQRSRSE